MKKKTPLIILAVFFLVQGITFAQGIDTHYSSLNPSSRISEISFKQISTVVCTAVSIYKNDVFGTAFRKELADEFGSSRNAVRFDVENMRREGLVRYYPVVVSGKSFIARLFPSDKIVDPPPSKILFEVKVGSPSITCQILPGINDMLEPCGIHPHRIYSDRPVATSL